MAQKKFDIVYFGTNNEKKYGFMFYVKLYVRLAIVRIREYISINKTSINNVSRLIKVTRNFF